MTQSLITKQLFSNLTTYFKHFPIMSMSSKGKNDSGGSGDRKHGKPSASTGHWSQGLKAAMEDPKVQVKTDDECVIIKDKYPKARYHYLALPKRNMPNLKSLTPNDIPILTHMYDMAQELVDGLDTGLEFRYGYHAIPSMGHVHLHVISQDFDSPSLKTKKHWNSFTSEYFIDSQDVIDMLEEEGSVTVDTSKYEQILKQDLRCHQCDRKFATIPALKAHLPTHIPRTATKPS